MDDVPFQVQGGMAYRFTRDVQLALYGGQYNEDTNAEDDSYNIASARLSLMF